MNIHPAVAFMSVIIGGALLGAVGALLALPAVAIAQALLSSYLERNEIIAELQLEEEEEEEEEEIEREEPERHEREQEAKSDNTVPG